MEGWMGWHPSHKSDSVCKTTSAKGTKWTEKWLVHWIRQKTEKMPDRSWCAPPRPESWSVARSYIFIRKLSTSRIHSGHEANWVVLATSWLLKSSTPDMEQLHPNCDRGRSLVRAKAWASCAWAQGSLEWIKTMPGKVWTITVGIVEPSCLSIALAWHSWLV